MCIRDSSDSSISTGLRVLYPAQTNIIQNVQLVQLSQINHTLYILSLIHISECGRINQTQHLCFFHRLLPLCWELLCKTHTFQRRFL